MNDATQIVRYSRPAIALHWLIALLIVIIAALGLYMVDLPDAAPERELLFDWHRWLGVTAFVFILARMLWRTVRKPPALVASMPRLQRLAASATHFALYALMVVGPLTGYLLTNRAGEAVKVFGWSLPPLIGEDAGQVKLFEGIHAYVNYALIAIAVLHALAAFKHHFIDRDETLARMVPRLRPKRSR